MTYADKLRDPRWQKKRLKILEAAGWKCEDCGRMDVELQIHHCAYFKNADPWDKRYDGLLMALCSRCHPKRQKFEDMARIALGKIMRLRDAKGVAEEFWSLVERDNKLKIKAENESLLRRERDAWEP